MAKHIITGPPCSGKTTLVDLLAKHDHPIGTESARAVIEHEQAKEHANSAYRGLLPWHADRVQAFQHAVMDRQRMTESINDRLYANQTRFYDRALPDQIAYCRVFGIPEPAGLRKAIEQAG